jgi:glycine/D-amino acid oxidase-like deaminating enzyme/nitrite reductase/ring-hydroxylating ferredoxin subunit
MSQCPHPDKEEGITVIFKKPGMIARDSLQKSLWQDGVNVYVNKPVINSEGIYDVIVVGGGITGVTTALLLQEAGKKCLIIEAANLCYGTTGGTTAHLNTILDTPYTTISKNFSKKASRLVATATADAITLVKENISTYNIDCGYSDAAAYIFADTDMQEKELKDIFEATKEAGVGIAYVQNIPIPSPFTSAVRIEGQAKFHPTKYVFALAEVFEKAGGAIIQHCRVTNVHGKEPLQVETSTGNFRAHHLVYATHVPPGINLLHLRCAPYRSYAMSVKLHDNNYPEDLVYDMYDPYFYYRTQVIGDDRFLIVGGVDHKTGHEENTFRNYLQLEAKIRSLYNVAEITHQWSSQYFEPTDGLAYIGHLPQHSDNVYVATGFGGNGITYSHVAARVLFDKLTGKEAAYDDLFNPNRIKPVAGFTNFVKHNADVTKEFLGKLFSAAKLNELSGISAGEGKIVSFEGKKLGVYKSEGGELFAVNPVCTHMKCDVKWNPAEKSWDCPCHGGRFDCQGHVLTGPPSSDLEPVSLEQLIDN